MTKARTFVEDNLNTVKTHLPEMGLADMALFSWDGFSDEQQANGSDIVTRSSLENTGLGLSQISCNSEEGVAVQPRCVKKGKKLREKASDTKLSALEDELANLRAQIAMIVSAQEKPVQGLSDFHTQSYSSLFTKNTKCKSTLAVYLLLEE